MWHIIIEKLITKLNKSDEQVYTMNWISSLNWLSMWKEKELYEHHIQKEQMRKYKN